HHFFKACLAGYVAHHQRGEHPFAQSARDLAAVAHRQRFRGVRACQCGLPGRQRIGRDRMACGAVEPRCQIGMRIDTAAQVARPGQGRGKQGSRHGDGRQTERRVSGIRGRYPKTPYPAHSSVSLPAKAARSLLWFALAAYLIAAVLLLGLRYWVLPQIDHWRPRIEAYASQALGARVEIGSLAADWRALNPSLTLHGLTIYGEDATPVLMLPSVSAVLVWRSALTLSPTLLSLRIEGPELQVRRDAGNRPWVAGQWTAVVAGEDAGGASRLLHGLGAERELALLNATVDCQDDYRQAPPVTFAQVSLRVYNGALSHRFALRAEPPADLARDVSVRGRIARHALLGGGWTGELYAEINDAEPAAWAPWLPVPQIAGRGAARAWVDLDDGAVTGMTLDTVVRGVRWHAADRSTWVGVDEGALRLQG